MTDTEAAIVTPVEDGESASKVVLTMSSMKLIDVPDKVKELCLVVEELYLQKNWLSAFPFEAAASLTALRLLDLSENRFTKTPDAALAISRLRTLKLNSNNLTAFPSSTFKPPAGSLGCHLHHLELSRNRLFTIRPQIGWFASLKSLSLAFNDLKEIPDEISLLSSLRMLLLNSNNISEFPKSILMLPKLRILDLSRNLLTDIPPEVALMPKLRELRVSGNPLTCVPFANGLRFLEADECDLSALAFTQLLETPAVTPFLQMANSLIELSLARNSLATLPSEIGRLVRLERLYVANNKLKTLPPSLKGCVRLQYIDASNNKLEVLPDIFSNLPHLQFAYLQYNKLEDLPASIVTCKRLAAADGSGFLDVRGNPLSRIPMRFQRTTALLVQFLEDLHADSAKRFTRSRVAVLGAAGVGKTALVKKIAGKYQVLKDGMLSHSSETLGIDVEEVKLTATVKGKEEIVTLSLWDFAGAETYHDVQQFFISHHEQYLVLFKMEDFEPSSLAPVEYWLNTIQAVSPGASVYLVGTFSKKASSIDVLEVNRHVKMLLKGWKPFSRPALHIIGSGQEPYWPINTSVRSLGIETLQATLASRAVALSTRSIPNSYIVFLRQVLKAKAAGKKVMDWNHLVQLGASASISAGKIKRISRWLHDQGFLVHFPDEHYGKLKMVVVNPLWLMKLFATVIRRQGSKNPLRRISTKLEERKHRASSTEEEATGEAQLDTGAALITEAQLRAVWNVEDLKLGQFTMLVSTLRRFRVVAKWKFESPHAIYLVPSLLPKKKCGDLTLTGSSETCKSDKWPHSHHRVYGLPFEVPGVFSSLMVRLYERFPNMQCWRNGLDFAADEDSHVHLDLGGPCAELETEAGITLHISASSIEKVHNLVCMIHWELQHLIALTYSPKLWSFVLKHAWICHRDLWIKRRDSVSSFLHSEGDQADKWQLSDISGSLKCLIPELYCLPSMVTSESAIMRKEVALEEKLTDGIKGEIWKATYQPVSTEAPKDVAVIFFSLDSEARRRRTIKKYVDGFVREVQVWHDLGHPNVVHLVDYYLNPPCFVLEYVGGGTLASVLATPEVLSWSIILRLAKELAEGMRYLHDHEPAIHHGDLVPKNVLVVSLDPSAATMLKVSNFLVKAERWKDVADYFSIIQDLTDAYINYQLEESSLLEQEVQRLNQEAHETQGKVWQEMSSSASSVSTMNSSNSLRMSRSGISIDGSGMPAVLHDLLRLFGDEGKRSLPDFDAICQLIYRESRDHRK